MSIEFSLVYKRPKIIASVPIGEKMDSNVQAAWSALIDWCKKNNLDHDPSRIFGLIASQNRKGSAHRRVGILVSANCVDAIVEDGEIAITVVPAGTYWERSFSLDDGDLSDLFATGDRHFDLPTYLCRDDLRPQMKIAEHGQSGDCHQRTICIPVTVAA